MEIVAVNVWEGGQAAAEARRFCDLWGIDGTVLLDEDGSYTRTLGIRGVPTNVFVAADGTVTAVGGVHPDDLETEARRLVGDGGIDPR